MGIPGPHNIHLNALKHHIRAIIRLIADCPVPELPQRLKVLGASQMDLYLGQLEETEISREVLQALSALHIRTEQQYRDWLEQHHHYQRVTLSDSSVWILRLGKECDRYIHLHPGRYAPATIRVKAAVLKTAIATRAYLKNGLISEVNDDTLNRVRKEVLELPSLKSMAESHAILKMIGIIETNVKGLEEF